MKQKALVLLVLLASSFGSCLAQETVDSSLQEVVLVLKSHYDIGYSDYAEGVLQKYTAASIPAALNLIDETKNEPKGQQFVWTVQGWPMREVLDRSAPGEKAKVESALSGGNLALLATPFNIETESSDPEIMVRGLNIASGLSRKYHLPLPRDAKQTDVPSHSWFLPTMLKHAGVDILHIGCNYTSESPEVPYLFWWEGPDGSRLMTFYYPPAYGTQLLPPAGWKYKTWLALMVENDNDVPPSYNTILGYIANIHKHAPNAKIRIGRISDFYDAIMKENPQLPVVRGDMPDTWIHGYMSMPREVKGSRRVSPDLYALESLNTLYGLWTNNGYDISGELADAYANDLLFDEHTWGLSMSYLQNGTWAYGEQFRLNRAAGMYDDVERSWTEKGDREFEAEKKVIPSLKRQLHEMAQAIGVKGRRIFVYNDLPWTRDGLVTVKESSQNNPGNAAKDLQTGEIIPLSNKGNILQFFAKGIPASGYRTYVLVDQPASAPAGDLQIDEAANTIENRFFKITFDPANGAIRSITEKATGREMVDTRSKYGFGQYLYERFSKEDADQYVDDYAKPHGIKASYNEFTRPPLPPAPHVSVAGGQAKMVYARDLAGVKATMVFAPTGSMPHDYSITITLPENEPAIDLTWSIDGKQADPWPEAGWISLPFNVSHPSFRLGRLGAVVDPAKDFIRGSNFDYGFLNTGMAVIDSTGKGFGLSTPDAPGISLGRPGLWKYSRYYVPDTANVFVNLYNNVWGTNFTEWIEGSWSVTMRIWGVDHFNNEQSIITPSEEFRSPLLAALTGGQGGKLPVSSSGIDLSRKGIQVTAFGKNPDGEGTILRLWEQAGQSGKCDVLLPQGSGFKQGQFCNLRGQALGKPFPVTGGKISVDINAYQPVSIILN